MLGFMPTATKISGLSAVGFGVCRRCNFNKWHHCGSFGYGYDVQKFAQCGHQKEEKTCKCVHRVVILQVSFWCQYLDKAVLSSWHLEKRRNTSAPFRPEALAASCAQTGFGDPSSLFRHWSSNLMQPPTKRELFQVRPAVSPMIVVKLQRLLARLSPGKVGNWWETGRLGISLSISH